MFYINCVLSSTASEICLKSQFFLTVFSERHVRVRYMLSPVRLSVCLSSVTFVRPSQAVQIFGNISTAL